MPDLRGRLEQLAAIAPWADLTMLRIIGRLLASDCPPDALFIVADALREASVEARFAIEDHRAAGLRSIATVVSEEAGNRGSFW